jgi:hypothetical protein
MKKRKSNIIGAFAVGIPVVGVVLGTAVTFGLSASGSENPFTGIGFYSVLIGIILFVITIMVDEKESNEENKNLKAKNKKLIPKILKRVEKFKNDNGFDKESAVCVLDEYFWINDEHFLSIIDYNEESFEIEINSSAEDFPLGERKIKIDDIDYYLVTGSLRTEQVVSGGGSSLTGAIVGGIVAGGVGAVIGSRKKIKSKSVEKDDRKLVLVYRQGKKVIKEPFPYRSYIGIFESLLPEKEHTYVSTKK